MKTTHNLEFESADYPIQMDDGKEWKRFRIGTCDGLWTSTDDAYMILAVCNNEIGNGHLKDVFEWFEYSCKRDKKNFIIQEFFLNPNFKKHLINKRGFEPYEKDNVIKYYK